MILIICEKNDAAKHICDWLSREYRVPIKNNSGYYTVGEYCVTFCRGHLLAIPFPGDINERFKIWGFDNLPIDIIEFPFIPANEFAEKQLPIINQLIKKATLVIHFGDIDREGQLIVDTVLSYLKNHKPVKRLWFNGFVDEKIKEGFDTLSDNLNYRGLFEAGDTRRIVDYLIGTNYSRAVTLKMQQLNLIPKDADLKGGLSLGRVITPTLKIIVQRYRDIKDFVPKDFYNIYVNLLADEEISFDAKLIYSENLSPYVDSKNRIIDKEFITKLAYEINDCEDFTVTNAVSKIVKKAHPYLYNLSKLQIDANKILKLEPNQTMACVQVLYLAGLVSYPRTDCQFAYEEQFRDYPKIKAFLEEYNDIDGLNYKPLLPPEDEVVKSLSWNSKKTDEHAHHAIIPLEPDSAKLHELIVDSKNGINKTNVIDVFNLIILRYIAQFHPPKQNKDTAILISAKTESGVYNLKHNTSNVIVEGWERVTKLSKIKIGHNHAANENNKILTTNDEEGEELEEKLNSSPLIEKVTQNSVIELGESGINLKSQKTSPPAKLTLASLIDIMGSIHIYLKDFAKDLSPNELKKFQEIYKLNQGYGTEATRAETCEKLFTYKYITKKVEPTQLGINLITFLENAKIENIYSPIISAKNEMCLTQVEKGELSKIAYIQEYIASIAEDIMKIKAYKI